MGSCLVWWNTGGTPCEMEHSNKPRPLIKSRPRITRYQPITTPHVRNGAGGLSPTPRLRNGTLEINTTSPLVLSEFAYVSAVVDRLFRDCRQQYRRNPTDHRSPQNPSASPTSLEQSARRTGEHYHV